MTERPGGLVYRDGSWRIVRRRDTGSLQICCTVDGQKYRLFAGHDLREAKRKMTALAAEHHSGWRPGEQRDDSWQTVAARLWRRHKRSAEDRGLPFTITSIEVYRLLVIGNYRCNVSGVEFSRGEKMGPRGLTDPWAPSIDRIDNRQGYVLDNVRIVSVAANIAMNAWGYDTLLRLARGVVRNANAIVPEPLRICYTSENTKLAEL